MNRSADGVDVKQEGVVRPEDVQEDGRQDTRVQVLLRPLPGNAEKSELSSLLFSYSVSAGNHTLIFKGYSEAVRQWTEKYGKVYG